MDRINSYSNEFEKVPVTDDSFFTQLAIVLTNLVSNNTSHGKITRFHGIEAPETSIYEYLDRIRRYFDCSNECFVLSFVYIDRIIKLHSGFAVSNLNIHRLLITSVMLAAKFFDDVYYSNAFYARIGGILTEEINLLEYQFLALINYRLFVPGNEYNRYRRNVFIAANSCINKIERPLASNILPINCDHESIKHKKEPLDYVHINNKENSKEFYLTVVTTCPIEKTNILRENELRVSNDQSENELNINKLSQYNDCVSKRVVNINQHSYINYIPSCQYNDINQYTQRSNNENSYQDMNEPYNIYRNNVNYRPPDPINSCPQYKSNHKNYEAVNSNYLEDHGHSSNCINHIQNYNSHHPAMSKRMRYPVHQEDPINYNEYNSQYPNKVIPSNNIVYSVETFYPPAHKRTVLQSNINDKVGHYPKNIHKKEDRIICNKTHQDIYNHVYNPAQYIPVETNQRTSCPYYNTPNRPYHMKDIDSHHSNKASLNHIYDVYNSNLNDSIQLNHSNPDQSSRQDSRDMLCKSPLLRHYNEVSHLYKKKNENPSVEKSFNSNRNKENIGAYSDIHVTPIISMKNDSSNITPQKGNNKAINEVSSSQEISCISTNGSMHSSLLSFTEDLLLLSKEDPIRCDLNDFDSKNHNQPVDYNTYLSAASAISNRFSGYPDSCHSSKGVCQLHYDNTLPFNFFYNQTCPFLDDIKPPSANYYIKFHK